MLPADIKGRFVRSDHPGEALPAHGISGIQHLVHASPIGDLLLRQGVDSAVNMQVQRERPAAAACPLYLLRRLLPGKAADGEAVHSDPFKYDVLPHSRPAVLKLGHRQGRANHEGGHPRNNQQANNKHRVIKAKTPSRRDLFPRVG
ncbi:hypothetical protein SDC9_156502 [bioreactor metagenome]|uniref:Uncharacterized protein n=1 Tax=bioreactor metagenome TaxID=1076179 RepID=A0A645F9S2_9ZZZZ